MCYSKESSRISLIIHILSAISLVTYGYFKNRNDMIVVGVVIFGIGTMQLAEYFIHDYIHCKKLLFKGMNTNRFGSLLGYYSLTIFQPLFALIGLHLSNCNPALKTKLTFLWCLLFLFIQLSTLPNFPKDKQLCTTKKICDSEYCSLEWPWNPWRLNKSFFGFIKWLMYFIIIVFIPLFAINQSSLFFIALIFHVLFSTNMLKIWSDASSCYWGPLLIYVLYFFDIPRKIPELPFMKTLRT